MSFLSTFDHVQWLKTFLGAPIGSKGIENFQLGCDNSPTNDFILIKQNQNNFLLKKIFSFFARAAAGGKRLFLKKKKKKKSLREQTWRRKIIEDNHWREEKNILICRQDFHVGWKFYALYGEDGQDSKNKFFFQFENENFWKWIIMCIGKLSKLKTMATISNFFPVFF